MGRMEEKPDAVWKALSDHKRRQMLDLLRIAPRTVGQLCEVFEKTHSRFAVMKHLGILKAAGLVTERKEGRSVWNHLNAVPLRRVYERWVSQYESNWAGSLLSLERAIGTGVSAEMSKDSQVPAVGEFLITQEIELNAPREKVFASLLDVDGWWCHYHAEKCKPKLVLEPFAGGRFYEISPEGESFFGQVTQIKSPELLRLSGPLGMARLPVMSVYEYLLEERDKKTVLKLTHRAYGILDPQWHKAHDAGWRELWTSLKNFVETGQRFVR